MGITKSAIKNLRREFMEQVIIIYLRDVVVPLVDPTTGDAIQVSGMITGLCLDIDEDYVYIDTRAVSHATIGIIELAPNEMEQMMDFMGPETEEQIN